MNWKSQKALEHGTVCFKFACGQTTICCFAFSRDLACSILWKINPSAWEYFEHAALTISNKDNVRRAWECKNCTLLMANAVMMSDSLCMMRAFPPGLLRSDSICISEWTWVNRHIQYITTPRQHISSNTFDLRYTSVYTTKAATTLSTGLLHTTIILYTFCYAWGHSYQQKPIFT